MLVVADTSPLIALVNIEHVEVLPNLFEQIVIPPDIIAELAAPSPTTARRSPIAGK